MPTEYTEAELDAMMTAVNALIADGPDSAAYRQAAADVERDHPRLAPLLRTAVRLRAAAPPRPKPEAR